MDEQPTFRALAAFKPKLPGADYPILVVSTAYRPDTKKYSTEVCFVKGGNVEWAMFELVRNGAGSDVASDWFHYEDYTDLKSAMDFMSLAQRSFHTVEFLLQGNGLYMKIYNKVCPAEFLAPPVGPPRKD